MEHRICIWIFWDVCVLGLYCSTTVSRLLQWQKVCHASASVKQLIGKDRKREKDREMKFGSLSPSCCQWQMAAKSHACARAPTHTHARMQPSHDLEWHTGSLRISLRDFSSRYSGPSGLLGGSHAAAGPGSGSCWLGTLLSLGGFTPWSTRWTTFVIYLRVRSRIKHNKTRDTSHLYPCCFNSRTFMLNYFVRGKKTTKHLRLAVLLQTHRYITRTLLNSCAAGDKADLFRGAFGQLYGLSHNTVQHR